MPYDCQLFVFNQFIGNTWIIWIKKNCQTAILSANAYKIKVFPSSIQLSCSFLLSRRKSIAEIPPQDHQRGRLCALPLVGDMRLLLRVHHSSISFYLFLILSPIHTDSEESNTHACRSHRVRLYHSLGKWVTVPVGHSPVRGVFAIVGRKKLHSRHWRAKRSRRRLIFLRWPFSL